MKCTTGVFSHPYRCPMKDTIGFDDIFRQVGRGEKPLVTSYMKNSKVKTGVNASEVHYKIKNGFCIGALNQPRQGEPSGSFDRIVRVEASSGKFKTFRRPKVGLSAATKVSECLQTRNYGEECYQAPPQIERGMLGGEKSLYIDTRPGCPAEREQMKVKRC